MESSVDEQLRTTLHYDDKEKLRRKLALLQREYIKTAQRLQRAERLEAVRKHVRSRITQQNHQDQKDPEEETSGPCLNPSSSSPNTTNSKAQDVLRCQGHTEGPVDSDNLRRSQVIRFLLPSDAACPQTPDLSHDSSRGHRPSPALRLRSRRSRLRWERRSAEAGRTTDSSQEGQEQSKKVDEARTKGEEEEEKIKSAGTEVVNESEELLSTSESGSPSLLLTHWSTHAQSETGEVEGKEMQGDREQREKESELRNEGKKESESTSLLLNHRNCAIHTEERGEDFTPNGRRKDGKEGGDNVDKAGEIILHEENSNKGMEQNAAEKTENEKKHNNITEIKEEKTGTETVDGKNGGFLDSCTLVEGLLFPVEYYVRTTRRMTFSQSQPDMQAVLLSQLSMGRPRRSRGRGRGRGLNRHTHINTCSDQHTQTVSSSPLTNVDPLESSHVQTADASPDLTGHSESSSEISNIVSPSQTSMDALSSPPGSTPHPGRGKRRRRGRGRGRGRGGTQTPRSPLCLDTHQTIFEPTSDGHQPTSSPVSLPGPDGAKSCLTPSEPGPVSDYPQAESTHSTDDPQPSSGVDGAECSSASEHVEKVYPIFLKSSGRESTSTRTSTSSSSWKSLLLPSSPSVQTSLLPLPSMSSGLLVNKLMGFDIHQDFHLPDDQFASLKLHKLRQVTVEPGVEHLSSPSYQTHRSNGLSQPLMPLPLPLSFTPTITESQQPAAQGSTETPGEQQAENLHVKTHTTSTEPVSVVEESAADCVDQTTEQDTVTVETDSSARVNDDVVRQLNELEQPASEKHTDCPDVVKPEDDQTDKAVVKTLSFECPLQGTPEEPPNSCTAVQMCKDSEGPGESPVKHLNSTTSVENKNLIKSSPHLRIHSQLLLSPHPPSAPCPFITPHPASSALLSSPTLPSLGLTPCPVAASLPLTSSPSAPALTLPPPHSPSTQALSPPPLSPCPSVTSLPPSQPLVSPASQNRVPSKATDTADQHHRAEPDTHPPTPCIQSQGAAEEVGLRTEETAEHVMRPTHTLKAPAGGCLVDSCCLSGPSGDLCVAAAGKWAVCLWSQTSASDWSLIHTWTFNDPVINVFPVPDAAGLMFVTLGQLEIRELRMLSCSNFTQVLLCEGIVQAVVGVPRSRVVSSSHSATGSTLQVFELSDNSSTPSSQPLVSPGVCVGALAPVDELPDALIGTDDDGNVFIWNLTSGQLLRRIDLGDGFSHTACLRGYTAHGVLFVLLQHQLLTPLAEEVEKEAKEEDEIFEEQEEEEERRRTALFSLVAVNPLSSKCVLAARLYPPKAWSGRLCEADVSSSRVVGLSQSGCVCVWELGRRGASRMLWAPESEGWQLARWGGRDTLLTGHHNGDVTLHCDSLQTSLCH